MTRAALALASDRSFGTFRGRSRLSCTAYTRAAGVERARVAVALARTWVYGGDTARAVQVRRRGGGPGRVGGGLRSPGRLPRRAVAGALGPGRSGGARPDHRPAGGSRRPSARRRGAVVGVSVAPHDGGRDARPAGAVQRQLRALAALAEESGSARVRFFAAARRGMYALMTGDLSGAAEAARQPSRRARRPGSPTRTRSSGRWRPGSRVRGRFRSPRRGSRTVRTVRDGGRDGRGRCRGGGPLARAGRADRAEALLHQLAGADFVAIPRDVDWLLAVAGSDRGGRGDGRPRDDGGGRPAAALAGRGVVNAGAVEFAGVVTLLCVACCAGGPDEAAVTGPRPPGATRRMAARWWLRSTAGRRPGRPRDRGRPPAPDRGRLWRSGRRGGRRRAAGHEGHALPAADPRPPGRGRLGPGPVRRGGGSSAAAGGGRRPRCDARPSGEGRVPASAVGPRRGDRGGARVGRYGAPRPARKRSGRR